LQLLEQQSLLAVHALPTGSHGETQTPFSHVCPTGQVIGACAQLPAPLQVSFVQVLLSSVHSVPLGS